MMNDHANNSLHEATRSAIRDMLADLGRPGACDITPIPGGRNNRVFRVDTPDGSLLLKSYYHAADDTRDRLAAEFAFSRFAWSQGLRCIPEPLAKRDDGYLALYEWIDGTPFSLPLTPTLSPEDGDTTNASELRGRGGLSVSDTEPMEQPHADLQSDQIDAAIAFLRALNANRDDRQALELPLAAEACFSIAEHLQCIERRVEQLSSISSNGDFDAAARRFVKEELCPAVEDVASDLRRLSQFGDPINQRWISPSDFGFHNALLTPNGGVRFFDFEYAGWDDPAKTVCDFFFQPQVPVPLEYRPQFVDAICEASHDGDAIRERVALLWPLYRIKWCGIMMNEFLPQGARRRAFGSGEITADDKRRQLAAAKACFERDDAPN